MVKIKKLFIIFIIFSLLASVSCSSSLPNDSLKVNSKDYIDLKELTAKEFDIEKAKKWSYIEENPYIDYCCYVSVKSGLLFISNDIDYSNSYVMTGDNGYFVGINIGEFDGWVTYYPYHSNNPYVTQEPIIVAAEENCQGFIKTDNKNGYLLTSTGFSSFSYGDGKLYRLYGISVKPYWAWEIVATFNGSPIAFLFNKPEESIYVVTDQSFIKISKDYTITVLSESEIVKNMYVNSIVYLNGSFFCGTAMGVYEYRAETGEEVWYPMEYEKYCPIDK